MCIDKRICIDRGCKWKTWGPIEWHHQFAINQWATARPKWLSCKYACHLISAFADVVTTWLRISLGSFAAIWFASARSSSNPLHSAPIRCIWLAKNFAARFSAAIKASFGGNFTVAKCTALVSFEIPFPSSYRTWKYAGNTINEAEVRVSATGTRPNVFPQSAERGAFFYTFGFRYICTYIWYGMVWFGIVPYRTSTFNGRSEMCECY